MLPRLARGAVVLGWLSVWIASTAAAATAIAAVDLPGGVARAGGGVVTVVCAAALAWRVGARTWLWTLLAATATVAGLVSDRPWALSSISVLAAVVSGVAAVLLTRPASTAWRSLAEYALALAVASSGAVAVAGIHAPVQPERYSLVVVAVALAVAIALVWQLGPGLHGSGRRALVVVIGGAVLVTGLLAYTQLLRTYGSPVIVERVDATVAWLTDTFHGAPRPEQALVGFPALVWGVGIRATRRQGWWVCAFGVLGTATLSSSLAAPRLDPELAALSAAYAAVIGAVLGLLVRSIHRVRTSRRSNGDDTGRRALRIDDVPGLRSEPGRTRPLN